MDWTVINHEVAGILSPSILKALNALLVISQ